MILLSDILEATRLAKEAKKKGASSWVKDVEDTARWRRKTYDPVERHVRDPRYRGGYQEYKEELKSGKSKKSAKRLGRAQAHRVASRNQSEREYQKAKRMAGVGTVEKEAAAMKKSAEEAKKYRAEQEAKKAADAKKVADESRRASEEAKKAAAKKVTPKPVTATPSPKPVVKPKPITPKPTSAPINTKRGSKSLLKNKNVRRGSAVGLGLAGAGVAGSYLYNKYKNRKKKEREE